MISYMSVMLYDFLGYGILCRAGFTTEMYIIPSRDVALQYCSSITADIAGPLSLVLFRIVHILSMVGKRKLHQIAMTIIPTSYSASTDCLSFIADVLMLSAT